MSIRHKTLPISTLERIDELCAEFEKRWQANEHPAIESLLADDVTGLAREVLLAELVALDIDYRRRRGETPTKEEYLERFPDHASAIDEVLSDDKATRPFVPPTVGQLSELFPSLEIIELLGVGGMGAVYKARQKGLDRLVALKILPEELARDVKFALRFTREARTLAKLNHPNIVALYEFGKVQDTHFFLMEFVDGPTLREVVRAGQLSPEHALRIVPKLCDALQFAHDKGVIHRDIKPENILLAKDGSVKIADFGLSRLLDGSSQPIELTRTHQVMGTLRYMAPEQLEGARSVDHRADIYSLGVVFYEMLTGELPIGRFAPPSRKVEIDVRLDEVVLRTLEKEPRRRYQRASQIKSDVENIATSKAESSSPATAPDPTSEAIDSATIERHAAVSLQQQELAGRLLLTRRELMERIKRSLRPLVYWRMIQLLVGVALIAAGAQCWARNLDVPQRLVSGIIVHIYGIVVIGAAAAVWVRINRIDYSQPVDQIRRQLDEVRSVYLKVAPLIGFPWWLLWLPLTVALGFDEVLHPNALIPSLAIGIAGIAVSWWLYWRALHGTGAAVEARKTRLAGKSIANAYAILQEIERAQIR